MSVPEFHAATDGWMDANGARDDAPCTRDELAQMMERFPDG